MYFKSIDFECPALAVKTHTIVWLCRENKIAHRYLSFVQKDLYRTFIYENIQSDTFGIYLEVYCFLRFQVLDVVDFDIKYHFEEGFADFLVLHNPAEHEIVGKSQFLILLYCSH